jgi:hypothetical protein
MLESAESFLMLIDRRVLMSLGTGTTIAADHHCCIRRERDAKTVGDSRRSNTSTSAHTLCANWTTFSPLRFLAFVTATVLLSSLTMVGVAAAQDQQTLTLKGLPGLSVVVMPISADAEADGLLRNQLQADVERTLRAAGVPVLSAVEQRETPNAARLRVTVLTYRAGEPVDAPYFYAISVRLFQQARLVNSATALTPFVATWESSTAMGVWPAGDIGSGIGKLVKERVNEFAEAWRATRSQK